MRRTRSNLKRGHKVIQYESENPEASGSKTTELSPGPSLKLKAGEDEVKESLPDSLLPEQKPISTESIPSDGGGFSSQNQEVKERKDVPLEKKEKWFPLNWRSVLDGIQEMRSDRNAIVDRMGCERTMEENVEPKVRRFQVLVSLMLSSQTKDEVTFGAMERLKAHGLTLPNILQLDQTELGKIIYPCGFWKKKACYIKQTAEILHTEYDDDIPDTAEGLMKLPGVGPKMAYIALSVAWGKVTGIGVDTHVHRISNRLGWAGVKGTKTPEKTREALESWLPEDLWQDINILLVGFGQTICLPVHPKCSTCLVSSLCPFGKQQLKSLPKKKKQT